MRRTLAQGEPGFSVPCSRCQDVTLKPRDRLLGQSWSQPLPQQTQDKTNQDTAGDEVCPKVTDGRMNTQKNEEPQQINKNRKKMEGQGWTDDNTEKMSKWSPVKEHSRVVFSRMMVILHLASSNKSGASASELLFLTCLVFQTFHLIVLRPKNQMMTNQDKRVLPYNSLG